MTPIRQGMVIRLPHDGSYPGTYCARCRTGRRLRRQGASAAWCSQTL